MADNSLKPTLSNDLGIRRISSSQSNSSARIYTGLYSEYPEINKKHDYRDCWGAVRANFTKLANFLCTSSKSTHSSSWGKAYSYVMETIFLYVPSLTWLPKYDIRWLRRDMVAGVTVAILLIPQSLAYAGIAGLKAHYGLYSSIIPLLVYSLTSSSTQIAPGVTASMCILIASAIEQIAPSASEKTPEYTEAALTLSFASGIIFVLLSLLKMGGTALLLSGPVMNGYILSSALIILMSQQGALWRIDIARSDEFYQQFKQLVTNLPDLHAWTSILSILCIIVLLLPKWFPNHIPKWFPMPLLIMVLMTILSTVLNLEKHGIQLVGELKSGLLPDHLPSARYLSRSDLWLHAFVISLVLYADNISLARAFGIKAQERRRNSMDAYKKFKREEKERAKAIKEQEEFESQKQQSQKTLSLEGSAVGAENEEEIKLTLLTNGKDDQKELQINTNNENQSLPSQNTSQKDSKDNRIQSPKKVQSIRVRKKPLPLPQVVVNANVELMAYGLATIIGSFSSSIMCAASFSRTSLNFEMRAYSQVSVMIQVLLCFICLVALSGALSEMPKCVLACVVVSSVSSLIISGIGELIFLWKVRRRELIEYLVIVIAPLIWGLSVGIILGVLASMLLQFWNNSQAEIVELGGIQLPDERDRPGAEVKYVDIRRFPDAQIVPDVPILEMRAELSFINYQRLLDSIEERIRQGYRCVVVSLAHTHRLDTTALRQLIMFLQQYRYIYIAFAQCRGPVRDIITRMRNQGLLKLHNMDQFVTIHDAVLFCLNWLSKPGNKMPFPTIQDESDDDIETVYVDEKFNDSQNNRQNDSQNDFQNDRKNETESTNTDRNKNVSENYEIENKGEVGNPQEQPFIPKE